MTIICLGPPLLTGSGERPVVPTYVGTLALAPERVCRDAPLPTRERRNSAVLRLAIPSHFSPLTDLAIDEYCLCGIPHINENVNGIPPEAGLSLGLRVNVGCGS